MKKMRMLLEPAWAAPAPYEVGSWARAADYLSDLLILDDKAEPRNA